MREAPEARDWVSIAGLLRKQTSAQNDCWIWAGCCDSDGYGILRVDKRAISVRRLMGDAKYDSLGGQAAYVATCTVKLCINPDHLESLDLPEPTNGPSCTVFFSICAECGRLFAGRLPVQLCSEPCRSKRKNTRYRTDPIYRKKVLVDLAERYRYDPQYRDKVLAASHARRADRLGVASNKVLLAYLCERDRWRCGICHQPIRAKTGPRRPSIDHIVPLSRGGTHDLANVQAAHYRCNLSKNNRGGGEQLLLVG